MERDEIKRRIASIKSRKELLSLINQLKVEECGSDTRPFTLAQLSYFSNPKNPKRYKVFTIPKKKGGKREISTPVQVLKGLLHYLNLILSSLYSPKECVMGFTNGKSVADNAKMHVRQNYVFNIDLSDFFSSIEQARVWKRLQIKPYNFSRDMASAIAGLCSIQHQEENGTFRYVLPQGAPTSPVLTNMICERLDHKITQLARKFGVKYSRYADDITFSSMHNIYGQDDEFISSLFKIIEEEHFHVNQKKTRLQKKGERQEVTGLTVNSHPNVTRKYIQWLRTILYVWEKYGFKAAYAKFYPKYKIETGLKHKGEPDMVNVISGKLLYLKMVKGAYDSTYIKLQNRFDFLVETKRSIHSEEGRLQYLLTYTLPSFEKTFSTRIEISENNKELSYGFFIDDLWQKILISPDINATILVAYIKNQYHINRRTQFYISLCKGYDKYHKGTHCFWLLTNRKPAIGKNPSAKSIDTLLKIYAEEGVEEVMKQLNQAFSQSGSFNNSKETHYKSHTPLATVRSLYKFSQDDTLKWFTHTPDSNSIDINTLLNLTKKQLFEHLSTNDRHETLNKMTWNNIKSFIIHEENQPRPLNADNQEIPCAWGDLSVRQWCAENPGKHPYYAEFGGRSFKDSIKQFKNTIEFRTDNPEMTFKMRIFFLVQSLSDMHNLDINFSDRFSELDPVQLFTDTRLIYAAIKKIFEWISDNRRLSEEVFIDVENNKDYLELIILHKKSKLAMSEKKLQGLDGDFEALRLMLLAVADLRMEADHIDGKSYSIICLENGHQAMDYNNLQTPHMKTPCKWTEMNEYHSVRGVKYFIKLYKNS